jgi:hypothetical protein
VRVALESRACVTSITEYPRGVAGGGNVCTLTLCVFLCSYRCVYLCDFLCACQFSFSVRSPRSAQQVVPTSRLARSMAEIQWVVTFEDVQDPAQMRARLDNSQFAKKCSSFMSRIVGPNLVCSFCSIVGKQALQKKCAQTFKDYGTFKRHTITQTSGQLSR